ncbi:MAG: hypothetical protein GF317_07425 [Candidatus Lokiarchaeota archaeon]|nr:hypothetical protein [Candidatus Lokiarchaeota archaeon]MBD3199539.1 hypothetical protein [Candidatus Lokiarchaeota archaeon]
MSAEEKQSVEYFLQWIENGGVSDWIEHFLNQGNEEKLREVKQVYDKIKQIFGF